MDFLELKKLLVINKTYFQTMNVEKSYLAITIFILLIINTNLGISSEVNKINRFKFNISSVETGRRYKTDIIKTKLTTLTAIKTEKILEELEGSLIVGYQEQKQYENVLKAARNATGYFIGISFKYDFIELENHKPYLYTKYQYHLLNGNDLDQEVEVNWNDFTFGIGIEYLLTRKIKFILDINYYSVNGYQKALEPLFETIDFENDTNINYGLGVSYTLKTKGFITIHWLAGYEKGFLLTFGKDFK